MLSAPGNPQIPRYFFQDKIKFKIYDTFMYNYGILMFRKQKERNSYETFYSESSAG